MQTIFGPGPHFLGGAESAAAVGPSGSAAGSPSDGRSWWPGFRVRVSCGVVGRWAAASWLAACGGWRCSDTANCLKKAVQKLPNAHALEEGRNTTSCSRAFALVQRVLPAQLW